MRGFPPLWLWKSCFNQVGLEKDGSPNKRTKFNSQMNRLAAAAIAWHRRQHPALSVMWREIKCCALQMLRSQYDHEAAQMGSPKKAAMLFWLTWMCPFGGLGLPPFSTLLQLLRGKDGQGCREQSASLGVLGIKSLSNCWILASSVRKLDVFLLIMRMSKQISVA